MVPSERDPTLNEVIKAIQIYSGLNEKKVRQSINQAQERGHYTSFTLAGMIYGGATWGIPPDLCPEICGLGHKLSDKEIEEFRLKCKGFVKTQGG